MDEIVAAQVQAGCTAAWIRGHWKARSGHGPCQSWLSGVVFEVVAPEQFGDIRHTHGHARMSGIGGLDGVHAESANGVGEFTAAGRAVGGRTA